VDERYATIPFPFDEIKDVPSFEVRQPWTLAGFRDYVDSWSASQRYREATGHSPVDEVWTDLQLAWGSPETVREARSPVYIRVGRVG
jgi:hypothetical protein